jgi:hypothetical protein
VWHFDAALGVVAELSRSYIKAAPHVATGIADQIQRVQKRPLPREGTGQTISLASLLGPIG